jgi:hypothetical protein
MERFMQRMTAVVMAKRLGSTDKEVIEGIGFSRVSMPDWAKCPYETPILGTPVIKEIIMQTKPNAAEKKLYFWNLLIVPL